MKIYRHKFERFLICDVIYCIISRIFTLSRKNTYEDKNMSELLKTKKHSVDVCVIGGGIGGMFTAISAARHGAKMI